MPLRPLRVPALALLLAVAGACGDSGDGAPTPPRGEAILRAESAAIPGAEEWTWIPFPDAFCTDATRDDLGRYRFARSATGLAISWGPATSRDLVVFLQGGGACWDFFTCGGAAPLLDKTASTGPFGPAEFVRDVYDRFPGSWLRRANLPAAIRDATVVFVPYCTGDVHGGDRTTTYESLLPGARSVTWHHLGRANVLAFLRRLAPTFPDPARLVVAGASGGGFGTLANYVEIRGRWPRAKGYLLDDSAPPLVRDGIPPSTRSGWYASWNLGASLDPFCPGCRSDLSATLAEIVSRYPDDRIALVSHLQDEVIRGFFGRLTITPEPALTPKPAAEFEADLRRLAAERMGTAAPNARWFFTAGDGHPTLDDPGRIATPAPGLAPWLELMLSDDPGWASASD